MILLEGVVADSGEVKKVWVRLPFSKEERPEGNIDGINKIFELSSGYLPGTCEVWLNGLKLLSGEHFTESASNEITLADSPEAGDELIVRYIRGN